MTRLRSRRPRQSITLPLLDLPFQPPKNPRPPYDWLEPDELERLHDASLNILENIGLDFLDAEALDIWEKAGADVDREAQHVRIDRGLVKEAIEKAPSSFHWRARNPAHDVVIGGNTITFGPCGGMAYVNDLDNGRRPGTMADYENLLRVSQSCHALHFAAWEQVTAQDIPVDLRHLHRVRAGFKLTDKVVMEGAHGRIITADTLAMMRLVFGPLDGEPVTGDVINVNSPLRYDDRMLGGLITYARAGQVTFITPFILAGAMSPVTMAAALAQQNAEVLAGVTLAQLVRPGAPVIYGGFTANIDLRSGSPSLGTPEGAWAHLVGGQLARRYNLPYRGSGSLTNSQVADAQAAYESAWTLWPAVLAHTNLIMHAAGWVDGGLTVSLEKYIVDLENLAMFQHFLKGFTIDEASLALDSIAEVGPGGHHFGTVHTQERYRNAFYPSSLADRQGYDAWIAGGGKDTARRANRIWKEILSRYEPPPLDPAVSEALDDYVARRERELTGSRLYE
ncbi:MAG: trimethylamine methyltransferase family protein [Chloroflexota bacterium]|jgi:trimethylamine---corrinoid protein Co-methyltransferase